MNKDNSNIWRFKGKNFSIIELDESGQTEFNELDDLLSNGWDLIGIFGNLRKCAIIKYNQK